jgi:hypothetical protein
MFRVAYPILPSSRLCIIFDVHQLKNFSLCFVRIFFSSWADMFLRRRAQLRSISITVKRVRHSMGPRINDAQFLLLIDIRSFR